MAQTYTKSNNIDPTKAAFGENSAGVSALQTQLNQQYSGVAGYTPLTVDGKYGPLTQAASAFKAPGAGAPGAAPVDPLNGVRRYTGTSQPTTSNAAQTGDNFYNNLNVAAPNEEEIRKNTLAEVQSRIDAIDNIYKGLISEEEKRGTGRLGQTRSINARSGTLGDDFGNANMDATSTYNAERVQAIRAEQAQKISDILANVTSRSDERVKAAKEEYFKNNEAKLAYNKAKETEARTDLKNLAATGIDLEKLSQDEYNALVEQTGYNDQELKAQFILNRPKTEVIDKQVVGSKYYQVSRDPLTGKIKTESFDLGFTPPQGYKPQQLDDGTLILIPETIDPSIPIKDQIMMYGKEGQFAKPEKVGGGSGKLTGEELKQQLNKQIASPEFQSLSAEDKSLYIQSQGGTPYDFGY